MRPINHTPGQTRYLTYQLIFPKDKEAWQDSIPFAQPLDNFLVNTNFHKRPDICGKILKNGEATWKDHNGVTHRVIIEEEPRHRIWGLKRQ